MDRRIRKTKQILKDALIELMQSQDFRKISVSELSKKADINRGTFYLHYLDIYDMINKIGDEIIESINKIVSKHNEEIKCDNYTGVLLEIAMFVKKNKDFFKVVLSPNGDIAFLNKIKTAMMKTFLTYSSDHFNKIPEKEIKIAAGSFIISGGLGLFQDWVVADCAYPAKLIINKLFDIFSR